MIYNHLEWIIRDHNLLENIIIFITDNGRDFNMRVLASL